MRAAPAPRSRGEPVADAVAAADEGGVGAGRAEDPDLRVGGRLVEAARQQPVVLEILHRRQQAGRRRASGSPRIDS